MMRYTYLLLILLFAQSAQAQRWQIEILDSGTKTSLRGLSVVNDNVVWVSGSNGIVGRSVNGGKNWKWTVVKGFEKAEFRDVEAFDGNVALIMSVGEPAYILKTNDGGDSWKVVFEDKRKGMFLDAMDFANNRSGIVIGDPIDGRAFMAKTTDSGNTWTELTEQQNPMRIDSGEAFFAASGSNVKYFANDKFLVVSGGLRSRLITNNDTMTLPLSQGFETTGANAIDVFDDGIPDRPGSRMIIVGGDFKLDSLNTGNCIYSTNGGKSWKTPVIPPRGYRSCVEFLSKKDAITCGLTGVDLSDDGGRSWRGVSNESFNVCRIARIGSAIYLAGNKGRIARLVIK